MTGQEPCLVGGETEPLAPSRQLARDKPRAGFGVPSQGRGFLCTAAQYRLRLLGLRQCTRLGRIRGSCYCPIHGVERLKADALDPTLLGLFNDHREMNGRNDAAIFPGCDCLLWFTERCCQLTITPERFHQISNAFHGAYNAQDKMRRKPNLLKFAYCNRLRGVRTCLYRQGRHPP